MNRKIILKLRDETYPRASEPHACELSVSWGDQQHGVSFNNECTVEQVAEGLRRLADQISKAKSG